MLAARGALIGLECDHIDSKHLITCCSARLQYFIMALHCPCCLFTMFC